MVDNVPVLGTCGWTGRRLELQARDGLANTQYFCVGSHRAFGRQNKSTKNVGHYRNRWPGRTRLTADRS